MQLNVTVSIDATEDASELDLDVLLDTVYQAITQSAFARQKYAGQLVGFCGEAEGIATVRAAVRL